MSKFNDQNINFYYLRIWRGREGLVKILFLLTGARESRIGQIFSYIILEWPLIIVSILNN